ncbi:MAG: hypothetical protein U9O59_06095 [Actinomycetota bacterium]|nr:hypothetical protein [Actinomycetota bacterium]
MDIEKLRKDAESFLYRIDKEYYLHFSGIKKTLDISGIYDEFSHLFDKKNIDHIKKIKDKGTGEEKKKAAFLLKFCTEGYIEMQTGELVDKIAKDEAEAKVVIDGREVPFRYSEVMLSNEKDKIKRDGIDDKRNRIVAEDLNGTLYDYWSTLHKKTAELGFSSYSELFSYLKEEDFSSLQQGMEKLLDETEDLYREKFGNLLKKEIGISPDESRRSDFSYFKRAGKYDVFFKKENLVPVFKETLSGMGMNLESYKNIYLDLEERKNKSPRAFCSTPGIPGEIYLVVMPSGGQDDFETILHEGGHALHFGNTGPKLDFEYRCLGDNAVTEGYAFTMEELMQNKQWLVDFTGMDSEQAGEFVRFSNLIKLWFCRRYAGKLKYELALHNGEPIGGRDSLYREILSGVTLMEYPPESYLKDVDDGFYCTCYIKAWIFQAQLKEYLYGKFGYTWYKNKKAGSFLKELWSYGQKYMAEEILSQLESGKMDVVCLIDSLMEGIKGK